MSYYSPYRRDVNSNKHKSPSSTLSVLNIISLPILVCMVYASFIVSFAMGVAMIGTFIFCIAHRMYLCYNKNR